MITAGGDLVISVEDLAEGARIRCGGELTPVTARILIDAVEQCLERGSTRLEVDCSDLGIPGAAAIKAFLEVHRRCLEAGASLRLVVGPAARRVLDLVGLWWLGVVSGYEGASLQDTLRRYAELRYRGTLKNA